MSMQTTRGIAHAMRRIKCLASVAVATGFFLGSAHEARPSAVPTSQLPAGGGAKKHWFQTGRASWYGRYFQGRSTASGEAYNMAGLTCAHRSLPLGTLVRVTNLSNHKSVVVRVNDRGPYFANRVVDLSYAAARFLGFSQVGTQQVRLDVLRGATELAAVQNPFKVQTPLPAMGR